MSSIAGISAAPRRPRARVHPLLPFSGAALLSVSAVLASVAAIIAAPADLRRVLAPLLTMFCVAILYVAVLYARDRRLPVFEVASFWVAASSLYGMFPLFGYIAGGLRWYPLSDWRLLQIYPGPAETGEMGWRYAVYTGAFVVTYLALRGRRSVPQGRLHDPGRARTTAILMVLTASVLFILLVEQVYGVSSNPKHDELYSGAVRHISELPLPVLQVAHNVLGIRVLLSQLLVVLVMRNWHRRSARIALVLFIVAFGVYTATAGIARSELVFVVMTAGMLYHRMVRPISLAVAVPGAIAFLLAFIVVGIMRDLRGVATVTREYQTPLLTAANEFQAIFGNAFDLQHRLETGQLRSVPWQIFWSDFYMLIPSQLLPFHKIDPSLWYKEVAGIEGVGFMFGAVAQAVVGFDWPELVLRGAAVAVFCAVLHRWYVRRSARFWPTIFYVFMAIWMYVSIRQSSFAFLYVIVYRFVPAMLAIEFLRIVLSRTRRGARALRGWAAASL